jgi:hypothetical protein
MSKKPLSRFEALAQRLVEGSFSRLFGGRLQLLDVANRLAHAVEDSQLDGQEASCYHVHLHPDDYDALRQENPDLAIDLTGYLVQLAQEGGLASGLQPRIEIVVDERVTRQQVLIKAADSGATDHEPEATLARPRDQGDFALLALKTVDAFLIVDGKRHVPLDRPFVTIGRRADNDIVIDATTVSRHHAQLRWRYGRFVIYDLGSRGGTLVNGQRVTESVLQAGDVISLSNIPLIYGEGLAEIQAERPRPPANQNQPTVTMVRPRAGQAADREMSNQNDE